MRVERLEALLEECVVKLCQIHRHGAVSTGCASDIGSFKISFRPSSLTAAVDRAGAAAAPAHLRGRAASRSRMNVAMTCSPAVSMRCTALMSRVTTLEWFSSFARSVFSELASATVHSAATANAPPSVSCSGSSGRCITRGASTAGGTRRGPLLAFIHRLKST